MKAVKIIRNIAAIIAGYAVLAISTPILALIMGFLANIPIIGAFLFFPAETSWAALVTINVVSVGLGASIASLVQPKDGAWGMKAYGFLVFAICAISLISLLMSGGSIWPAVLSGGTGLLVALEF